MTVPIFDNGNQVFAPVRFDLVGTFASRTFLRLFVFHLTMRSAGRLVEVMNRFLFDYLHVITPYGSDTGIK